MKKYRFGKSYSNLRPIMRSSVLFSFFGGTVFLGPSIFILCLCLVSDNILGVLGSAVIILLQLLFLFVVIGNEEEKVDKKEAEYIEKLTDCLARYISPRITQAVKASKELRYSMQKLGLMDDDAYAKLCVLEVQACHVPKPSYKEMVENAVFLELEQLVKQTHQKIA